MAKECTYFKLLINQSIKGTVNVISSYPTGKDVNVRFTTVSLKPLSGQ